VREHFRNENVKHREIERADDDDKFGTVANERYGRSRPGSSRPTRHIPGSLLTNLELSRTKSCLGATGYSIGMKTTKSMMKHLRAIARRGREPMILRILGIAPDFHIIKLSVRF
jgi:hypothetical protein